MQKPDESNEKHDIPCTSASLLDHLIQKEASAAEDTDPLDHIGNIGEAIIGQFSSGADVGTEILQNALKMFDQAMAYTNPQAPPKRKYKRKEAPIEDAQPTTTSSATLASLLTLNPVPIESSAKRFHQNDLRAGFSPRTKFDVDCSDFFLLQGSDADTQFNNLHKKLEKERTQMFDDQVSKDVERLLNTANRVHGPREWTAEEKAEFTSYCRSWRSGALGADDKLNLQKFYSKAYGKVFQGLSENKASSEESAIDFSNFMGVGSEDPANQTEDVPGGSCKASPDNFSFSTLNPRMKYEKEKEFRSAINNIFTEVFKEFHSKKQFIPKPTRLDVPPCEIEREHLSMLMSKFSIAMDDPEKEWNVDELQELRRFYTLFREKNHLPFVQTKEFGKFLRKAFGRLEHYELQRENDTSLQEKRKFWQEYRKTHVPPKRERKACAARTTPVRPYIKSNIDTKGETEEERRLRRAAYLRKWRLAQKEKHSADVMSQFKHQEDVAL
ncbi:DNA helicase [Caenorhabditis elegans]|uniref:DNA helicase n=1 Tax=Caenorhabditis elegans TaxID=6239 RepID=Q17513_CAEEL|nr:DNA helicase [Caenorhabditis elegans]CAA90088.1 DNA helicase [Caenorhabditis elegans]|eukprot:NP_496425.1 Uncharacterized protein CELE_B0491.6 [Caenorhabditis elegans]